MTRAEIEGLIHDTEYRVENPSAWDRFDQGASDLFRQNATALRAMLAREEAMREALRAAHDAIASLPQDALGIGHRAFCYEDDPAGQYPIRDELLAELARHLAQGDGE